MTISYIPKISFIIVSYNSLDYIKKLLDSFKGLKCSGGFEIIIADNCSGDKSIEFLEKAASQTENMIFLKLGENGGFAKASNAAADLASGEFLVFLNPDTAFIDNDLDKIVDFYNQKKQQQLNIGLVGVKTINEDGSIQLSCRAFPTLARQFYESSFLFKIFKRSKILGSYFMTWYDHKTSIAADWVSGSFMFIKKGLFKELGGFDEIYFMYSEDTDLCLKLKRKGYVNYYYADFQILHYDGALANKNKPERIASIWHSRYIYFKKNYGIVHAKTQSILFLKGVLLRMLLFFVLYIFTLKSFYKKRLKTYAFSLKIYYKKSHDFK